MAQEIKITQTSNADMNIGVPKTLTAVEWFEQNISKYIHYQYEHAYEQHKEVTEIFEQAKQMEKEQIINAYKFGLEDEFVIGSEKYYNQTYNVQ